MASSAFLRSPPTFVILPQGIRTPKFQGNVWGKVILTAILVCQGAKRQGGPVVLGHVLRPGARACQRFGSNESAVLEFKDSVMKGQTDLAPQIQKEQHALGCFFSGFQCWRRFSRLALFQSFRGSFGGRKVNYYVCMQMFWGQTLWIRLKDPNDYLFCDTGAPWGVPEPFTVTEWQFDGQNCQGAFWWFKDRAKLTTILRFRNVYVGRTHLFSLQKGWTWVSYRMELWPNFNIAKSTCENHVVVEGVSCIL